MRILHLSSESSWRGGEQQIAYLAQFLKSQGIYSIVAAKNDSEMIRRSPVPVRAMPFKGEWDLYTAWSISVLAKEEKIDIIHAHSGHSHTLGLLATMYGGNANFVVSKRTDYPIRPNAISKLKFNHPNIDRFLCVSDKIRSILQADLKYPEKAVTVHSGIDMARFPQHPTQNVRSLVNIPLDTRVVISTAAISHQKDYPTFVKVAQKLCPHHNDLHFVIVGTGPQEAEIKHLVEDAGLLRQVHFMGFRTDLPQFLGSADAFLITSKEEGLGTSIIDAFAVGIPVVATDAGGISELVRHGHSGLLAPVGDSGMLANHVENLVYITGQLKESLKSTALEIAKDFSFERTGQKTLAIYQEILGRDL